MAASADDALAGSKVTRIIREAGALGIDVHVIALRKAPAEAAAPPAPPAG